MSPHQTPPGWYPLHNDPGTERYWDGNQWTEHHRMRPQPSSSGSSGGKILLGILIGVVLLAGGCLVSSVILVRGTVETFEQLSEITIVEDGQPGSPAAPLAFGTNHSRVPGPAGSAWTLSVDDVSDIDGCIVVTGRATLDAIEGERLTSLRSSFPEIALVDADEQLIAPTDCGREALAQGGRLWAQDTEVEAGTTFEWFETFDAQTFRWVSVSGTLYSN